MTDMTCTAKTYWNGNGQLQAVYDQLKVLIPREGPCSTLTPKLEKLRVAANCYYDLHNNGLCNRAKEFYKVFGFGGKSIAKSGFRDFEKLDRLEAKMTTIIMVAGLENLKF